MNYYGITDIGSYRTENQDAFGVETIRDNVLLAVVCDGMGGAAGGKLASTLAVDTFLAFVKNKIEEILSLPFVMNLKNEAIIELIMKQGASEANAAVFQRAKASPELTGMGTTLVAALLMDREVFICNVGDSRLYHLTDDSMKQITKDHSYVQMMIDNGMLDPSLAADHPDRNVITRAIGTRALVAGETFRLKLNRNETLLLCSDGLSGFVSNDTIYQLVMKGQNSSLKERAESLIEAANSGGGRDNITALLITYS